MVRKFVAITLLSLSAVTLCAQQTPLETERTKSFEHLDLSLSAGVPGIGFELSTPLNSFLILRSGFQFMPHFKVDMSFGVGLEKDGVSGPVSADRFNEMSKIFSDLTGCQVDDRIDMIGEPAMYNASLLLDIAPFRDKRWHFTAGLYAGPARIAKAYNTTEDMPSLFSINLYNRLYESSINGTPLFEHNGEPIFLDPDVSNKFIEYGRMTVNIGEMKDGSGPCYLLPDTESMMKVNMKVNPIRPYIGFGFNNQIGNRHSDSKYSFGFDAGLMFWGGTPQILAQRYVEVLDENYMLVGHFEEVDLAKDVANVRGKVGDYVDVMKKFKVCPMVNIKLTRRLF